MDNKDLPGIFHPLIARWFRDEVGEPTEIQLKTWPAAAGGKHLLITAPTGCGKTLAAFLWSINQLITSRWEGGSVRVLYISPLKALNNDIRKNLLGPVERIKRLFRESGEPFPGISILTRSGDTPAGERRKMLKSPPEILITTPESLNIILSSPRSISILKGVRAVIMDEIHSIMDAKRGTHMITAVDRLVEHAGEFQRIALSATITPLETAAEFAGGFRMIPTGREPLYRKREVEIIVSSMKKEIDIDVDFPSGARENLVNNSWWPSLVNEFRNVIAGSSSTLLFTNSRKLAEKVTRLINEDAGEPLVYSHHGSLSREIRLLVEEKLKMGELRGIVATSSLELGIDIGKLERVVLVQAPFSISSALQRIGRSGHSVGEKSRGTIYPIHGRDFIDSAVIARAVSESDIEEIRPVESPLDVLAQIIISLSVSGEQKLDDVFFLVRSSYPYRNLSRQHFDMVIRMLAGRYADTRIRELEPRINLDMISGSFKAGKGAAMVLYMSGGTIPDRGYFQLRVKDSGARIGELDEEFTWERSIGDRFTLGVQTWQITNISHNDVEVVPFTGSEGIIPFWKADGVNRDFHFAEKVGLFLKEAGDHIEDPRYRDILITTYHMKETAAEETLAFLRAQIESTGSRLPHRYNIVIEHYDDPGNRSDSKQVIIHTIWGGKVNNPFALALGAAWEEKYGYRLEIFSNNDSILIMLPHSFRAEDIFAMVTEENLEAMLRKKLESSGLFGAQFRMNAGIALLLPRGGFKKRLPLWLNRLRSKKLMDAVKRYRDFPILLETWRSCLRDEFDMDNLLMLLDEIREGRIGITEAVTGSPSPFASGIIWRQVDKYMYQDDTSFSESPSDLSGELIRKIINSDELRPRISSSLIGRFEGKIRRTENDYSPSGAEELIEHVKERLLIPPGEWELLMEAIERDHGEKPGFRSGILPRRVVTVKLPGSTLFSAAAIEMLPRLMEGLELKRDDMVIRGIDGETGVGPEEIEALLKKALSGYREESDVMERTAEGIVIQFLSFYGPVEAELLRETFGFGRERLLLLLDSLLEENLLVEGEISDRGSGSEICHADNLEILIRMSRRERQPHFEAREITHLPPFLAAYQGVAGVDREGPEDHPDGGDRLLERLKAGFEKLFGYPAPVNAWEEYIIPARVTPYYTAWLDSLMQTTGLTWFGCGNKKISFSFREDLDLFIEERRGEDESSGTPLPELPGRYTLFDIMKSSGLGRSEAQDALWSSAWDSRTSSESFETVRKGILRKFNFRGHDHERNEMRAVSGRWHSGGAANQFWYSLSRERGERDLMEEEEQNRERVRQLLARYGILFREIFAYEQEPLKWGRLFRTLRLMELSGEILSGHFFRGIPGLQFISHEAFRFLREFRAEGMIFWLNAADPASLCGVKVESLKAYLPSRLSSTFTLFHGDKLVMIVRKNCSEIEIFPGPGDRDIPEYLRFFSLLLTRDFNKMRSVTINTINGKAARSSEYARIFLEFGFTGEQNSLSLIRKYQS